MHLFRSVTFAAVAINLLPRFSVDHPFKDARAPFAICQITCVSPSKRSGGTTAKV